MLPTNLGKSDHCTKCGQLRSSNQLVYEGPDLEAVCFDCLRQLDPARAALLEKIHQQRRPG
jgi:hypothetical protein